ncbi:cytochrome P450 [Mycobacterium intracellulare]|uniref:cytochrome P450 n=1 Tax=Mycobacterium intracellulare TaxID=1767 RepID=UPI001EEEDEE3|nr:cytochrome P450 [Mycobacterium intracellulare]MEE3752634.1 cytochrome P450 [Mycobacterium intracellulare]
MDLQSRAHWLMGYGLPRATLKLLARRGDPFAKLLIDNSQPANVYHLIEQIRQRGRISAVVGGGWVTADAQIVRDVLRSNKFRTVKPRDRSQFRVVQWMFAKTDLGLLNPVEPPSMLVVDPPEHARLRRLVSRAFTPRAIDGLRDRIQEITNALLNDLGGDTARCDLITNYASQIPIEVIAEMMGIPGDEITRLYAVADPVTKLLTSTAVSWRDFQTATAALREFEDYIAAHIERLRHSGADTSILSTVLQDSDLTDIEVRTFAGLLLGAGFITTAHAFGNAVVALVRHPDQLARLQAQPDGWPNAIEEVLRYDSVFQIGVRVATETLQIDGHTVREGSAIFLLGGGANRDPAIFERPDEFDTARANARDHIGFGSGVHACLGAPLARIELQIGLQTLFERFPRLTLAGEPTLNDSTLLHGIKNLPVNLGPATVTAG